MTHIYLFVKRPKTLYMVQTHEYNDLVRVKINLSDLHRLVWASLILEMPHLHRLKALIRCNKSNTFFPFCQVKSSYKSFILWYLVCTVVQ